MKSIQSKINPEPDSGQKSKMTVICALTVALMFSLPCAFTAHAQDMMDSEEGSHKANHTATTTASASSVAVTTLPPALPATPASPGGPFDKDMYTGLYINPLGFMQLGPMIGAEFTFKRKFILEAHLRFPQLGMLTANLASGGEVENMKAIGVGAHVKYFLELGKGGLYFGPLLEYSTLNYEHNGSNFKDNVIVFAANAGYKFQFSSGFFMRAGGFVGSYKEISVFMDGEKYEYLDTQPLWMLELSFGIAF